MLCVNLLLFPSVQNVYSFVFPLDQLVEGPEGAEQLTVGSVLHFLTGTSTIPPRGFSSSIHVYFSNEKYPVVSTCVPQIVVPTGHTDVELQNILRESVIGAAGYGRT